jgi:hypothetical protein
MRFLRGLIIGLLAAFCGLHGGEKVPKPSFHVLVVYQASVSKLHRIDALNIKKSFKNIARSIRSPINLKMVEQREWASGRVLKWAKRIRSTDIAVVYYSGPQAENPGYEGSWPSIYLPTKLGSKIIPIEALPRALICSKPKLSVVIADCYDTVVQSDLGPRRPVGMPFKKTRNLHRVAKLRKIWLQSEGTLTLCSHRNGERGYGIILDHRYRGGIFTEALLLRLGRWNLKKFPSDLQMLTASLTSFPQHIEFVSSIKA